MSTNIKRAIPRTPGRIVPLANHVYVGLQAHGAAVGVATNTAAKYATDLFALIGDPGVAGQNGKSAAYARAHTAKTAAYAAFTEAKDAGRRFVARFVSYMRPDLGTRWNPQWRALGFLNESIAVPRDPDEILTLVRAYLVDNPGKEFVANGITAQSADTILTTLRNARGSYSSALSALKAAKQERDAAMLALLSRTVNVRKELGILLPPDDPRWYDFGFVRPVDGTVPNRVEGLKLQAVAPGSVLATWDRAPRARNYRVSRMLPSEQEPVVLQLTSEKNIVLSGLPPGQTVKVFVSAVNPSGETAPATAEIVVP